MYNLIMIRDLKKPKLVASDIGGTLIKNDDVIPLFTCKVLNKLVKKDIPVVLITGFNYSTTKKYTKNLDKKIILMIQNGAVCIKNNRIYWEYQIPALDAEQIYNFMDKRKIPIIVYKGKKENFNIFYKKIEVTEKPKPFVEVENIENFYNITGISTLIPNILVEKTREEIETIIKDKFQLIYSKGAKFSWLEITPIEARKDIALKRISNEMSISISDAIYFGDNFNDLDVLNTVGYPIIVKNSVRELKEKFSITTDSVFNEGVAKYLDKLFDLKVNVKI